MEKKLKIVLCVVTIILIAIIAFVGIYSKNSVIYKSNLPNYVLGEELGEQRISKLVVSDETKEIIYDKDGKVVDSIPEGANEADYKKEQEKVNKEDLYTSDNYKKVKEICEGRLKDLKIENYVVRIDENTGNAIIELEDNLNTDTVLQYLLCTGDFSITDSEDKTVLLDKSDVKEAKVVYSRGTTNGVTVYLNIVFDKEGKDKLAEISRNYMKVEEENKDTSTENTENNAENTNNEENKTEENKEEENKTETKQKQVTLTIEGNSMLTTSFGEEMLTGELPISLGTATSDETLQEYREQAEFYAMLINNETMPLEYEMGTTETAKAEVQGNDLYMIIGAIIAVVAIVTIFMIFKFKTNGIFAGLSFIATFALLLLMIRYTRTEVSLNAIAGGIIIFILDAYLVYKMLSNISKNDSYDYVRKTTLMTYLENMEVIIISLILAVVFTFMQYAKAFSFGMTMFYGIISAIIVNLVLLRTMLVAKYKG